VSAKKSKERLTQLLDYVQHMVRLPERVRFSIKDSASFVYLQENLHNRIGVEIGVRNPQGPAWLKLVRLQRVDPPDPGEQLRPWLSTYKNPARQPKVLTERTTIMTEKECNGLVERGLVDPADVTKMRKRSPRKEKQVQVKMHLQNDGALKEAIDQYLAGPWKRWAKLEKPRRATMSIYDDFFKLHESIQAGAVEAPVEVIWGIGVAIWKTPTGVIKHPLIEVLVEIDIDPVSHEILVRPRNAPPQLFVKPFLFQDNSGIVSLQEEAKNHFDQLRKADDPREINPFQPETFEPLLRLATTLLSSSANYYPDLADRPGDPSLPTPADTLVITDTWAIYARPRSDSPLIEDLERLKTIVEKSDFDSLPTAARRFVADLSDRPTYQPRQVDLVGTLTEETDAEQRPEKTGKDIEIYFPKEYNEAQVKILRELDRSDGVVVQGPPGTGKTHTIANIICHYLATGRRVLVTSQGEPALNVLRDFIPEEIRRLTISLLTKDHVGLQQLETAVTLLAGEVSRIVPENIEKQIIQSEKKLRELRRQIEDNERTVREIAERQLMPREHPLFGDGARSPAELAERLEGDQERHEWLPDEPGLEEEFEPQFTEKDLAAARQARLRLGRDLQYWNTVLPAVEDLPSHTNIQRIHESIVNADQNDPGDQDPDFPKLSAVAENARTRASALIDALQGLIAIQDQVDPHPWLRNLLQTWAEAGFDSAMTKSFEALVPDLEDLAARIQAFDSLPVSVPELGKEAPLVAEAVARAAEDRRPFGTLSIGRGKAKELFAEITIGDGAPVDAGDWRHVKEYFRLCEDAGAVATRWNEIAESYQLPPVAGDGETALRELVEQFNLIAQARHAVASSAGELRQEILELFPHGIDATEVCRDRARASRAIQAIEINLNRDLRGSAKGEIEALLEKLDQCEGSIVKALAAFLRGKVGNQMVRTSEISTEWDALLADLRRLQSYTRDFEMVRKLADLVERSGGPKWAEALRTEPAEGEDERWTPAHALETWGRKRLATYLHGIDGRESIRELSRQNLALEAERKSTLTDIVRLRTYLGLYVNMTERAKSALVRFTAAIRRIGSGEGPRSRRHRRDAQEAMNDCCGAVPCWIIPIWRVSETLPPEIGSFDLVIVDEASQSDILALPTLLRGQKLLIVGDDKQVSPITPFVEERKIAQLRSQHLNNQPFVDLLIPGSSLYDLANAVFSGRRIMLDEHFRCVEPIIRFSFQFYPEKIIPVRIPKASERLDPPLIDVYVPEGERDRKKINRAEAHAIVDEIERLVTDPAFHGRSIGVVSLIGAQQGQYIQNVLLRRIGQEKYLEHHIDCGDSATFQGRERDIMFVSMVTSPGRIGAQTAVIYQQRFNVALSRARDRMYLFRSVQPEDLNSNDLKARVIEHFTKNRDRDRAPVDNLVELCETDLERQVFEHLVGLGYRATPRVRVGDYSIDIVVEGADDRRLAIELDGDREITADAWLATWSQQKTLERVGWRFWRCWASSFVLDREACVQDLLDTLAEMEIEPIGQAEPPQPDPEQFAVEHEAPEESPEEAREEEEDRAMELHQAGEEDEEQEEEEDLVIDVGDRVLVSFSDDPSRYRTLQISADEHDPSNGIFRSSDVVAMALLGASRGEEIEVPRNPDVNRVLTIIQIEKPGARASLTRS